MSLVLVVFPGAPSVSESAQEADRELEKSLENKIKGIRNKR